MMKLRREEYVITLRGTPLRWTRTRSVEAAIGALLPGAYRGLWPFALAQGYDVRKVVP